MILADLGRALLLGSIPVAAIWGVLGVPQLLVVAFLAAALTSFFDSASVAYLPGIVGRAHIVKANSILAATGEGAIFVGLSASGFLVQLLSGPIALGLDALSFLASGGILATIRRSEPRPARSDRESVAREIRVGIRVVVESPILRSLAVAHALMFVFWGTFFSIYLVYATREIGVGPAAIGVISALGSVGALVGAAAAGTLARRAGIGRAMIIGLAGMTAGAALLPLAPANSLVVGVAFLVGQQLISDMFVTVFDVLNRSTTQSIVDSRLLGRVQATMDVLTTLVALIVSLLAGIVAETVGLRAAIAIGVLGGVAAVVWLWLSPVRLLTAIPDLSAVVRPTTVGSP